MSGKSKSKNGKMYIVFIVVLLILVGLFFINLFKNNDSADYSNKVIKSNISAISTFDYSKVKTVEDHIKEIEDTEAKGNFDVSTKLTKAQYRKIFNASIIVGDSITEGLSAYGYLGEDHVFCQIGASVMHGDDIFASAASSYPKFAFFSFGMNDMGNYTGHADMFVAKYKKLITSFKKTSPDTKVFINGITPPSKEAIGKNSSLANYIKFNNALKEMCKDMKITYIDNSYIIKEHKEFYASDGIHVTSAYYPLWMNNMIMKAGL